MMTQLAAWGGSAALEGDLGELVSRVPEEGSWTSTTNPNCFTGAAASPAAPSNSLHGVSLCRRVSLSPTSKESKRPRASVSFGGSAFCAHHSE